MRLTSSCQHRHTNRRANSPTDHRTKERQKTLIAKHPTPSNAHPHTSTRTKVHNQMSFPKAPILTTTPLGHYKIVRPHPFPKFPGTPQIMFFLLKLRSHRNQAQNQFRQRMRTKNDINKQWWRPQGVLGRGAWVLRGNRVPSSL